MKALVGAFNQEKALVGAFSVIVQPVVEPMDRFAALLYTPCHVTEGDGGGHLGVAVVGLGGGLGLGLDSSADLARHGAVLRVWGHAVRGGGQRGGSKGAFIQMI